jgi:predicted O-methyltransferase YrrM
MRPELEGVEGWLSDEQAERLHLAASTVPAGGRIVEIGSFRGRSTIVLARGADPSVEVIAIDPHAGGDRGPREVRESRARGEADLRAFRANLARAGVADRVRHVPLASRQALGAVDGRIDLLYVDGAHRFGPARSDISCWGRRVSPAGTLLIHDAFSSVGVTLAILTRLAFAGDFVYVGRVRSLGEYRRAEGRVPVAQRVRSAARQLAQLPWFGRNLLIKLALVGGRRGLAERLGQPAGDEWPY